jgi:RsiW-degrading membrane proteinase PrsW (M82 family)
LGIVVSAVSKLGTIQQPQDVRSALTPIIGQILALYGFAFLGGCFVLLIAALGFYYLIERRNQHFARQQLLFSNLQNLLSNATQSRPVNAISRLGYIAEDSIFAERPRPAGIWSVLFLFVPPIVGLAVAYSLTQDLRNHEGMQASYQTVLVEALREADYQPPVFTASNLHKRDPLLFIILSAITAGLFWIYWYYTLLHDYNEHFAQQAQFEDQIIALLKPSALRRLCKSCGETLPENARFCPSCGIQSN